MDTQKTKAFFNKYGHVIWIIALAIVFITFCSKCSFIFPFNDWCDSNIYFTIGKSMVNGKVLYRDIFDHKGPYIFMLHSLAYLISNKSFLGVYFIEIPLAALFCYSVYKLLLLYVEKRYALLSLPVLAFVSYASLAFCHGDSAEEIVMPFMALSLLHLFQFTKGQKLSLFKYAVAGIFTAIAFWIKFTLCGFFMGWILLAFIFEVKDKTVKHAFCGIGSFLGAFILSTLPVIIYFGVNKCFGDLFEVYFIDNLFVYSKGTEGEIVSFLLKIGMPIWVYLRSFAYGLFFYILLIPGFIYFATSKEISRREKIALFVTYALMNLLIFGGGRGGKYYGLPVCIFAFTGTVAAFKVRFTQKLCDKIVKRFILSTAVVSAVLFVLAPFVSPYRIETFKKKSELFQFQFAEIISEKQDATILNYGTLDLGLYTVTGTVPECKYFFKPNIAISEIMQTHDEWVIEGKTDFVVLQGNPPEIIDIKYEQVAEKKQKYETKTRTYYLYRLKDLNK